jgi:hypothetical protein
VSASDIRQQIDAAEKELASLTETAAMTAAASYRNPDDAALSAAGGDAVKRLNEARNTLTRLQLALSAIEAEEQAAADQAELERRLIWRRPLEKQRAHAAKELAKEPDYQTAETVKLQAAEAEMAELQAKRDEIDARLAKLPLIISVQEERLADSRHRTERWTAELAELDEKIANFPLSAAAEAKQEAEAKAKAEADAAEARAQEAEAEAAKAREAYENELIEAPAAYSRETDSRGNPIGWSREPSRTAVLIKRRDLPQHEVEQAEAAAWLAGQEAKQKRDELSDEYASHCRNERQTWFATERERVAYMALWGPNTARGRAYRERQRERGLSETDPPRRPL